MSTCLKIGCPCSLIFLLGWSRRGTIPQLELLVKVFSADPQALGCVWGGGGVISACVCVCMSMHMHVHTCIFTCHTDTRHWYVCVCEHMHMHLLWWPCIWTHVYGSIMKTLGIGMYMHAHIFICYAYPRHIYIYTLVCTDACASEQAFKVMCSQGWEPGFQIPDSTCCLSAYLIPLILVPGCHWQTNVICNYNPFPSEQVDG